MSEPTEPLLTPQQMMVQSQVELCLNTIHRLLGERYSLTLVGRYHGPLPLEDADLLMTVDTRENVLRVINRFLPESFKSEEANGTQGTDATNNPEPGKEQSDDPKEQ